MERRSLELHVGGQTYRVVSAAPEDEVRRAASLVSAKFDELGSSRNTLFLVAMALANDALVERDRRLAVERRTRDLLRRLLVRVEHVLDPPEGGDAGR
ncbi:MAG: cell division protein ZapA [Polyangiaceae bacterium]|jgi:cell division protein ZapA